MRRWTIVIGLLLLVSTGHAQLDAMVPFASFTDDAAHRAAGDRVRTALQARGIAARVECGDLICPSCGRVCNLSIDSRRYAEAMEIARRVIEAEHLPITPGAIAGS